MDRVGCKHHYYIIVLLLIIIIIIIIIMIIIIMSTTIAQLMRSIGTRSIGSGNQMDLLFPGRGSVAEIGGNHSTPTETPSATRGWAARPLLS